MLVLESFIYKKYGRLKIIEKPFTVKVKNKKIHYCTCMCDCGKITTVDLNTLRNGRTISCGCYQREKAIAYLKENCMIENTNLFKLNGKAHANNKLGHKGVYFDKQRNKYRAYISFQKKNIKLGYFDTLEEAIDARKRGEEIYHKPILEKYKGGTYD